MKGTDDEGTVESPNGSVTTAIPDRVIGRMLGGRYLIERELGRGGMGIVYLARDKPELHSRPVVVKVLLAEALKNEAVVAKFYQEIESLTRLDDPGVVGIFDAGQLEDGAPYLVMQYVEGTTLRAAMKREGMDLQQTSAIIRQVGRSITAAHDAGILHRDLKPENIMLRRMSSGEQLVKIIDFGIAKVKNSMSGPSPLTGLTVGTIGYMSPEQLGARPLSPASDIYSLGVIGYEMLTGRNPFNPDSVFQLLEMQRAGVRVKASDLRPSVSERAQQILFKALAFDPHERFQRAQDFGDQLAAALISEGEAIARTTQVLPGQAGRGDLPETVAPAAAAETLPLVETQKSQPTVVTQPKPKPKPKLKPRSLIPWLALGVAVLLIGGGLFWWRSFWTAGPPKSEQPAVATNAGSERSFTYFLTPAVSNSSAEERRFAGNEQFRNDSRFKFVLIPEQSGALYLFNLGSGAASKSVWNVLFPTPARNKGSSLVAANQRLEVGIYFDRNSGDENLSIIWSEQPLPELEAICKDAARTDFEIRNSAQAESIKAFLNKYQSSAPRAEIDNEKKQTVVRGRGEILVTKRVLEHTKF